MLLAFSVGRYRMVTESAVLSSFSGTGTGKWGRVMWVQGREHARKAVSS